MGLVVGTMTLLPLDRGLSVAQALAAFAFTGWVVFALELPTSGFADAFGRRPVYAAAAVVQVGAAATLLVAQSFWAFVLGAVLMGVFRALDSGPLEAWFVDTVHESAPGADVDRPLAVHSTMLGVGIAAGALLGGGLAAWHPFRDSSALDLPFAVFTGLAVVHLLAVLLLMRERRATGGATAARRAVRSARATPGVIRGGLGLLRTNRALRGLVVVEVFWSVAMIVFETFQPIRLAELLGSEERAGAWMGAVAAAGWGVFAVGAALAGLLSARIGVARAAVLARVLDGAGAVVMGLVAGPVSLVVAYLVTYSLHGAGGPMHHALLHREAESRNRATVLSMNSMMMFAAFSTAAPLLGLLAEGTSTQVAMVTAGAFSVLGAVFYLPARRAERARAAIPAPMAE
ncbi:MAG: MFS transporter [Dermatophilaceae bacterium]